MTKPKIDGATRSGEGRESLLESVCRTQNRFIIEPNVRIALKSLLDQTLALTESEYGFVGEIQYDEHHKPFLRVLVYTDIAWDAETRKLLAENATSGLVFSNLQTLFGSVITTGEVVVTNDAPNDPRAGGIPHGHPNLDKFLGVPLHHDGELVGMIGLANRPDGYHTSIVDSLQPIIDTCAVVTHIKAREARLQRDGEKFDKAKDAERLIEFSGRFAHDLNNMLTVVLSIIEASQSAENTYRPLQSDEVKLVHNATIQAVGLSKKILAYAGMHELDKQIGQLNDLVCESVELIRTLVPSKIELTEHYEAELPQVNVSRDSLGQVVTNAILNAVEAIGDREGHIRISTCQMETDMGRCVQFRVEDDGAGMDAATRVRAFDPYFSTKGAGRGFGLASSLAVLKSHNGMADLISSPGVGTTFFFEIPVVTEKDQAQITSTSVSKESSGTILLVDDQDNVRSAIATLLEHVGYRVIQTSSGKEAISILREGQHSLEVAVVDISMPGMDGIETLGELRKLKTDLPVVLMTGYTQDHLPDYVTRLKNLAFIRKPFDLREFQECVAAARDHQ